MTLKLNGDDIYYLGCKVATLEQPSAATPPTVLGAFRDMVLNSEGNKAYINPVEDENDK